MNRFPVHKLGKLTKVPLPSVGACQLRGLDLLAAGKEVYRDAFRTVSVCVVIVVPDLLDRNLGQRFVVVRLFDLVKLERLLDLQFAGLLRVGDYKPCLCVSGNLGHIAFRNLNFLHRVRNCMGNVIFTDVHAQIVPAVLPAVRLVQCNWFVGSPSIRKELNCDCARMASVIHPDLLNLDTGLLRRIGVRQCGQLALLVTQCQLVTVRQIFLTPGIYDILAFRIALRQIVDPGKPVVSFVQGHKLVCLLLVCHQIHVQAARTLSVTVFVIFPDLFDHSGSVDTGIRAFRCTRFHTDCSGFTCPCGRESVIGFFHCVSDTSRQAFSLHALAAF